MEIEGPLKSTQSIFSATSSTNQSSEQSKTTENYITHYEFDMYKDSNKEKIDHLEKLSDEFQKSSSNLEEKVNKISGDMDLLNVRFESFTDQLTSKLDNMNENVNTKLAGKFETEDEKIKNLTDKVTEMDAEIDGLSEEYGGNKIQQENKKSYLSFWGVVIPAAMTLIYQGFNVIANYLSH